MRRTKTDTIISALRILSGEIETDDGVVPAALIEAADRMEELKQLLREASGHSSYGQWSESFRLKVTKVI